MQMPLATASLLRKCLLECSTAAKKNAEAPLPGPSRAVRFLKVHLEPGVRADALAAEAEEQRHRDQRERNEPEQRVAPAEAQRIKHVEAREWEERAEGGAEDGVCGNGGGGVHCRRVSYLCGGEWQGGGGTCECIDLYARMQSQQSQKSWGGDEASMSIEDMATSSWGVSYQISLDGHHPGEVSEADERSPDDGHDPVDALVCRPAVDEDTDGQQDGSWDGKGELETVLGLGSAAAGLGSADVHI
jgi:hypothetical protein